MSEEVTVAEPSLSNPRRDRIKIALVGGLGAAVGVLVANALSEMHQWGQKEWVTLLVLCGLGFVWSWIEKQIQLRLHGEETLAQKSPSSAGKRTLLWTVLGGLVGIFVLLIGELIDDIARENQGVFWGTQFIGILTSGVVSYFWARGAQQQPSQAAQYRVLSGIIVGFGILAGFMLLGWGGIFNFLVGDQVSPSLLITSAGDLRHYERTFVDVIVNFAVMAMTINAIEWGMWGYIGGVVIDSKWGKSPSLMIMFGIVAAVLSTVVLITGSVEGLLLNNSVWRAVGWGLGLFLCPVADRVFSVPNVSQPSTMVRWVKVPAGIIVACLMIVFIVRYGAMSSVIRDIRSGVNDQAKVNNVYEVQRVTNTSDNIGTVSTCNIILTHQNAGFLTRFIYGYDVMGDTQKTKKTRKVIHIGAHISALSQNRMTDFQLYSKVDKSNLVETLPLSEFRRDNKSGALIAGLDEASSYFDRGVALFDDLVRGTAVASIKTGEQYWLELPALPPDKLNQFRDCVSESSRQ